jgi:hypothetical protein
LCCSSLPALTFWDCDPLDVFFLLFTISVRFESTGKNTTKWKYKEWSCARDFLGRGRREGKEGRHCIGNGKGRDE